MKDDSQKGSSNANDWLYGKVKSPGIPYTDYTTEFLSSYFNGQDENYSYYPVCSVHNVRCVYADMEFSCGRNCPMVKYKKTKKEEE